MAEILDPKCLYTQETIVFEAGVKNADLGKNISFGVDISGRRYVTDGNHRAVRALIEGVEITGEQVSTGNFDVTTDPDFHPISGVRIV